MDLRKTVGDDGKNCNGVTIQKTKEKRDGITANDIRCVDEICLR